LVATASSHFGCIAGTGRAGAQQQPAAGPQDANGFGDRVRGPLCIEKDVVEDRSIELVVPERQPVHVALAQGAVRQTGEEQLRPCEAPRIGIDVHTDCAARARCQ
jgi:hypothetical protein